MERTVRIENIAIFVAVWVALIGWRFVARRSKFGRMAWLEAALATAVMIGLWLIWPKLK